MAFKTLYRNLQCIRTLKTFSNQIVPIKVQTFLPTARSAVVGLGITFSHNHSYLYINLSFGLCTVCAVSISS
jgi:hypothetical protein